MYGLIYEKFYYVFDTFRKEIASSVVLKVFFVVILSYWLLWLWKRRRFYVLSMKLRGPLAFPIIGNAIEIGAFGKGHELIDRIREISARHPSPCRIWFGLDFHIFIAEPEDLEVVLLSRATSYKDKKYDCMKSCIGPGLLSASGASWRKNRLIVNQSFTKVSLRNYQDVYVKHAKNLVNSLKKHCDSGSTDIIKYCKRTTGDIMAEALFEEEFEFYRGDKDDILSITSVVTELIHDRMIRFWQESDLIYSFSEKGKLCNELMAKYRTFYYTVFREKIKKYATLKKNLPDLCNQNDDSQKACTVFEALANAFLEGQIGEQELLDEFNNIYNPGLDSTYSQIGFFILVLAMHKDWQDKVWAEIKEYYDENIEHEVQLEDLNKLPTLEMCIKELIRLFSTAPVFVRKAVEDLPLPKRNIVIPAGTHIIISTFLLHRNPEYWEDPDNFRPERFSTENSKKRPHFAYLPFSGGLRGCVAQNFAMDMLKTIGVYLIRNFEFHSDLKMSELKIKTDISIRSAVGYNVHVKRRIK